MHEVRRLLEAHEAGPGRRYSATLRHAVTSYGHEGRDAGLSFAEIAAELGLRCATLRRWCESAPEPEMGIVPVEVVGALVRAEVAIVSPSGYRLEGLP